MALYKRSKTWWADFAVDGQRYRQSLGTQDWREAQSRQKELIAEASQGKLVPSLQQFARLSFSEAADRYLQGRKLELSQSSSKKEQFLLLPLRRFLQTASLTKINGEGVLGYREWRAGQDVGPATINMEVGVLRRLLKRAGRWHLVAANIRPLKEPRSIGRAMALDEKMRLLAVAGQRPEWQAVRLAMILALNTTMRGCELKSLRWRDVDLMEKLLTIRKSKTAAGERVIPLNSVAFDAVLELRELAKEFGRVEPDHFLFPSCEYGHIDPTRPQKSWRSAWRQLTKAVQCSTCGRIQPPSTLCRNDDCKADIHELRSSTTGLRFHDLRHHAITELAESQASDQTIMAIAGHVSPRMLAHYSHVRLDAKRNALEALSRPTRNAGATQTTERHVSKAEGGGCDTNHDTNESETESPRAEVPRR